jgi:hypothetical protein
MRLDCCGDKLWDRSLHRERRNLRQRARDNLHEFLIMVLHDGGND